MSIVSICHDVLYVDTSFRNARAIRFQKHPPFLFGTKIPFNMMPTTSIYSPKKSSTNPSLFNGHPAPNHPRILGHLKRRNPHRTPKKTLDEPTINPHFSASEVWSWTASSKAWNNLGWCQWSDQKCNNSSPSRVEIRGLQCFFGSREWWVGSRDYRIWW